MWKDTTLGEYYDVRDGTHDSPQYVEDGYPLVTSKNLKNGKIDLSQIKYISEKDYQHINKRSGVDVGDVLMAMIGTIGNPVEIIEPPKFAIKNVALFKTNAQQSPAYLRYFLSHPGTVSKMMSDAKGTTQKFVGLGYLRNFPISVPPLAEQERIVAKLDAAFAEIDEAVSLAQYKIADIQSLKNALLGSNLSNTKTTEKLGDVIEIARGGSPRPIKSFITTEDDGVNWIKIGDTKQGGKYISTTKEKIKPSGVSRSRYVKENDFLLSNSMSFGRPYILKTTGCIHDGWLVLSKYQESFIADYLYYLLSSSLVQNQFESLARGSTVRNLNIELVSQVIVPILPLTEQQRVVAKLDVAYSALEMANDAMEKSKRNYQALKSAILSQELQSNEAA